MFERVARGRLSELLAQVTDVVLKGEYTIVIAGSGVEMTAVESIDIELACEREGKK